jgi:hypothetical protein
LPLSYAPFTIHRVDALESLSANDTARDMRREALIVQHNRIITGPVGTHGRADAEPTR